MPGWLFCHGLGLGGSDLIGGGSPQGISSYVGSITVLVSYVGLLAQFWLLGALLAGKFESMARKLGIIIIISGRKYQLVLWYA